MDRIQHVRQNVATEIGIVMPKVRIRDNLRLEQTEYRIKIADIPVAEAALEPAMLLAIDTGGVTGKVRGIEIREPAQDRPAIWIEPALRDQAESFGYKVIEPAGVLAAHLAETINRHADEILTRDATKHLIGELKKTSPAVIEELIPAQMKLAEVQRILQMLLREQVPIRQLGPILETLGDCAARIDDPVLLSEQVRRRLARVICTRYRDADGTLHVLTLDPALEDRLQAGIEQGQGGLLIRLPPYVVENICDMFAEGVEKLAREGYPPVVLVGPQIRAALKQLAAARLPRLVVLSYNEITRDTQIESVAMISEAEAAMAA